MIKPNSIHAELVEGKVETFRVILQVLHANHL
jgi:hypothetical protein